MHNSACLSSKCLCWTQRSTLFDVLRCQAHQTGEFAGVRGQDRGSVAFPQDVQMTYAGEQCVAVQDERSLEGCGKKQDGFQCPDVAPQTWAYQCRSCIFQQFQDVRQRLDGEDVAGERMNDRPVDLDADDVRN